MSVTNNTLVTKTRRHKIVLASAGEISLPKIVGMAFGDGGTDAQGQPVPPDENQTALTHELLRKPVDRYTIADQFTVKYECTLLEGQLAGESISEIGLYDEDGDILSIRTMMSKGVDGDIEQTYSVDDIF